MSFQIGELRRRDLIIIISMLANIMRAYGFFLLVPMISAFLLKEGQFAWLMFWMALPTIAISFVIRYTIRPEEGTLKHSVISLVLSWMIIPLLSSIPYIYSGIPVLNSIFDSFSGWTGTGLTMVEDPAMLSVGMNFFRALSQWIGGFGILILALLVYERPKTAARMFEAEGRTEDFYTNVIKIARLIFSIYIAYTIMGIILMLVSGVGTYDSVINVMTAVSTGGFSNTAAGTGALGIVPMSIITALMLIGGISFTLHYDLFMGKAREFFSDPSLRFMFLVIFVSMVFISIEIMISGKGGFFDGIFYVVSALTGCGHNGAEPLSVFPAVSKMFIVLLMISGASYGSTTGALKIWRTMIIIKVIRREVRRVFLPERAVIPIRIGNNNISDETALKAASFMLLYLALLFIGSVVFMFAGYTPIDSLFTVASAQGNVGLNILTENYFNMNPLLKIQLIGHMFLGRMEIIPMLVFIRSFFIMGRY